MDIYGIAWDNMVSQQKHWIIHSKTTEIFVLAAKIAKFKNVKIFQ